MHGRLADRFQSFGDALRVGAGTVRLLAWTASPAALDVTTRALTEYLGWLGEAMTDPEPTFVAPVIYVPGHGLTGRLIPTG